MVRCTKLSSSCDYIFSSLSCPLTKSRTILSSLLPSMHILAHSHTDTKLEPKGTDRHNSKQSSVDGEWMGQGWWSIRRTKAQKNDCFWGGCGKASLESRAPAKGEPSQDMGPDAPRWTQTLKESELAQGRSSPPPLITPCFLPAHLASPRVSLGEAGQEEGLNCQWLQRLLIKESKWNGSFVF